MHSMRVGQQSRLFRCYKDVGSPIENIFTRGRFAKFIANHPPVSVQRAALPRLKAKARENPHGTAEATVNSGGSIEKKLER